MKQDPTKGTALVGRIGRAAASTLATLACCLSGPTGAADLTPSHGPVPSPVAATPPPPAVRWQGPPTGPPGLAAKTIAFIAEDLRNGGIVGVAQGVREAARELGWTVKIFDAGGSAAGRDKAFVAALSLSPDGMVLCGSDALENRASLAAVARRGIVVVGWHAGPMPGPIRDTPVAMNVTTDPHDVATITAAAAVTQSGGRAGVVIFTDSRYRIAMNKADVMVDVVRNCRGCSLLEVRDVALSDSDKIMPAITGDLLRRYGKRWTHALAINDVVFDYAVPTLIAAGVPNNGLSLLSAGDGSTSAFLRIQAQAYQTGTVAEPLNQQGWQLLDELNRLLAHQPVSGFAAPAHLVTSANIEVEGGPRLQYDPDGYRELYRRIWKR
jgi:ribose transport system substrate-binding protein